MQYIKVKWLHQFHDEPIEMYSELDDGRWELRKVEVFPDGHRDFASKEEVFGTSQLSEVVMPSLDEIARDPQFVPELIEREAFERVWRLAVSKAK